MKHLYFIILFPVLIFSQNGQIENDSIPIENFYIKDYNNHLNIKLDVTNEQIRYYIPYENNKAGIKTNLNISYGVVFSYRFLSVRLGFRPKLSKTELENKGKTDRFKLGVKLLFDKWTHRLEYNYTRGFYIENTNDFTNTFENENFRIQFPYLTTNIFSGSSQYKLNDNYSVKAIESNTEIQLKSAGTILTGMEYALYFVRGTDHVKLENQELEKRESFTEFTGFTPIFNAGYHYTFVYKNYWYLNAYANPGFGIDFYKSDFYSANNQVSKNNTALFFDLKTGVSAGYNGRKIYFGGEFKYDMNSEKFNNENISLQPIKNNFHFFFGYRFNAPKQVSKPVEYIEDKVPILKKDSN